jgi:hypothetical protein
MSRHKNINRMHKKHIKNKIKIVESAALRSIDGYLIGINVRKDME